MKRWYKILIAFTLVLFVACSHYSTGYRGGNLIKFSRKGMMFKTWEGTINLGGMKKISDKNGDSYVANIWNFSIDESAHRGENIQSLADTLSTALEEGSHIRVHYNQELMTNCSHSRGDEQYFVDKVEIIR